MRDKRRTLPMILHTRVIHSKSFYLCHLFFFFSFFAITQSLHFCVTRMTNLGLDWSLYNNMKAWKGRSAFTLPRVSCTGTSPLIDPRRVLLFSSTSDSHWLSLLHPSCLVSLTIGKKKDVQSFIGTPDVASRETRVTSLSRRPLNSNASSAVERNRPRACSCRSFSDLPR